MLKNYKFAIAFFSWMTFVTWASLFPFSGDDLPSFSIPHVDKVVHFTFYFIAVILGVMFIRERTSGEIKMGMALFVSLCSVIVFGIIIEVLQYAFTTTRMGDILDALSNSIGALCGIWVIKFLFSRKRWLNWK